MAVKRPETDKIYKCEFCDDKNDNKFTEKERSKHYPLKLPCCKTEVDKNSVTICRSCVMKHKRCPKCEKTSFSFKDDGEPDLMPDEDKIHYLETHCEVCSLFLDNTIQDVAMNCNQCKKRLCVPDHTKEHVNNIKKGLENNDRFLKNFKKIFQTAKDSKLVTLPDKTSDIDELIGENNTLIDENKRLETDVNKTMTAIKELESKCTALGKKLSTIADPAKEILNFHLKLITELVQHKYSQDTLNDTSFLCSIMEILADSWKFEETWNKREDYIETNFREPSSKQAFHDKAYIKLEESLKNEFENVINVLTENQESNFLGEEDPTLQGVAKVNDDIRRKLADITMDLWQLESVGIHSLIDYDD